MAGVEYIITVDDTQARKSLSDLKRRAVDMTPLMEDIGAIVVGATIAR